ncbi:MAG: hypothetical protein K2X43_00990 [Hyphomonadaceae bacterium]|nr:hypothetical protein [Hyphomonadaceae bacterium]
MRKILRRIDDDAPPAREAAKRLQAEDGVTVLDEQPSSLLVEGDAEAIEAAVESIEGWSVYGSTSIKVPDARPRVLRKKK